MPFDYASARETSVSLEILLEEEVGLSGEGPKILPGVPLALPELRRCAFEFKEGELGAEEASIREGISALSALGESETDIMLKAFIVSS